MAIGLVGSKTEHVSDSLRVDRWEIGSARQADFFLTKEDIQGSWQQSQEYGAFVMPSVFSMGHELAWSFDAKHSAEIDEALQKLKRLSLLDYESEGVPFSGIERAFDGFQKLVGELEGLRDELHYPEDHKWEEESPYLTQDMQEKLDEEIRSCQLGFASRAIFALYQLAAEERMASLPNTQKISQNYALMAEILTACPVITERFPDYSVEGVRKEMATALAEARQASENWRDEVSADAVLERSVRTHLQRIGDIDPDALGAQSLLDEQQTAALLQAAKSPQQIALVRGAVGAKQAEIDAVATAFANEGVFQKVQDDIDAILAGVTADIETVRFKPAPLKAKDKEFFQGLRSELRKAQTKVGRLDASFPEVIAEKEAQIDELWTILVQNEAYGLMLKLHAEGAKPLSERDHTAILRWHGEVGVLRRERTPFGNQQILDDAGYKDYLVGNSDKNITGVKPIVEASAAYKREQGDG